MPDSRYGCQKFPSQTQRRLFGIADKQRQLLESVRTSRHGDKQDLHLAQSLSNATGPRYFTCACGVSTDALQASPQHDWDRVGPGPTAGGCCQSSAAPRCGSLQLPAGPLHSATSPLSQLATHLRLASSFGALLASIPRHRLPLQRQDPLPALHITAKQP